MAFNAAKFDPGPSSKGIFKLGQYDAGADNVVTVEGATYFDNTRVSQLMQTGDVLLVKASNGTKFYSLTVSGTDVTLSSSVAFV